MPPPPAEQLTTRIFLGPALRTQPDRRLVKLVREGYESAFEEIVRRYRKPLDRFAAAIVGGHSEDVTQDAFSKALLALRGSEAEIELRPWLYRIVRNTALNDLRDRPPASEQLGEAIQGGQSAAVEAERREEISELMSRLRALPEPQRAAIVMRELEGLSHEEIAAALGVSGGAARQAIFRARATLRDGLALIVPLPLLRMLFDHGAEAAAGGAVAATGTAAGASGAGGAALGGLGAGGLLKIGAATVLVAGSVGAGVAVQQRGDDGGGSRPAAASSTAGSDPGSGHSGGSDGGSGLAGNRGRGSDGGESRSGKDHGGKGSGGSGGHDGGGSSPGGGGSGGGGSTGHDGGGSGGGGQSGGGHESSGGGSDGGGSGSDGGSGSGGGGDGTSGKDGSGGGGGDSGSGDLTTPSPAPEEPVTDDGGGGGTGSGRGGS
jgi:RNA polymerase sigma factor (sigma-70 family)